jgi:hypothetical protein
MTRGLADNTRELFGKMMRRAAAIKPGLVHIRAFIAESSAISACPYFNAPHIDVIARFDRAIQ